MSTTLNLNWESIAAACTIVSFVIMLATAYLRLFISKAVYSSRDEIIADMRLNYVQKENHRPEMHEIKKAITRCEGQIERLHEQVTAIEIAMAKRSA